jgi:hypothetical protein
VHYSTVQYSTVQYSTVQYSTVQRNAIQCSRLQCNLVQRNSVQCSLLISCAVPEVIVGRAVDGGCAEEDVAESIAACLKSSNLSHVLHSTFFASAEITSVCVAECGAGLSIRR